MNVVMYGLQVTVIGLLVVFFILTLLILFIYALGYIMKERKADKTEKISEVVAAPAPVVFEQQKSNDALDPELIAVISAAIAAMDGSGKALVVRSVRRVSGWNRAARDEQVYRY